MIIDDTSWVARGYVAETDLWRIAAGHTGAFVPEAPQRASARVTLAEISVGGTGQIEIADLSSHHGGRIAVNVDDRRRHVPVVAQYPVRLQLAQPSTSPELMLRGMAVIDGQAESLVAAAWRRTVTVLLRESGF